MAKDSAVPTLDAMIKSGVLRYGNDETLNIKRLPFGIPKLDEIIGGGLPYGRNLLFVGNYSSGKTFLAQQAMRKVLEAGGTAAYVDVENSYDKIWFEASGIDTKKLLVSSPEYGERAVDVVRGLLDAGIDIVVLDSIGALVPLAEDEASIEQQFIGSHPKLVTRAYKAITVANKKSIFIAINQVTNEIGIYGKQIFPGGKKQGDLSHIILMIKRDKWIEEEKKKVGFDISVTCIKNKTGRPWGECILPFYFNGEIDEVLTNIDMALANGIIERNGPYYKSGEIKWLGKSDMRDYMKNNPDYYEAMVEKLLLSPVA